MNHQDLINTCVLEQIQGLLFSDLSGPLKQLHCQVISIHGCVVLLNVFGELPAPIKWYAYMF